MASTPTTVPGYVNRNEQEVLRGTGLPGNDHQQAIYVLRCRACNNEYGANGSDIFQRKCPECQNGATGLPLTPSIHDRTLEILRQTKKLAKEYRDLTGKPLGVTGEIAEFEAARHLGIELTPARQEGFDAIDTAANGRRHLQIKGRCLLPGCKPSQRIGGIKIDKSFDAVLLVLLDQDLEATEIFEADREAVLEAIKKPGSKARNERGALSVRVFKKIGRKRWPVAV